MGLGRRIEPKLMNLLVVFDLGFVSKFVEPAGHKSVSNGEDEDDGGDQIERVRFDSLGKSCS